MKVEGARSLDVFGICWVLIYFHAFDGESRCAWTPDLKGVWRRRAGAGYDGITTAGSMISSRRRTYIPLSLPRVSTVSRPAPTRP